MGVLTLTNKYYSIYIFPKQNHLIFRTFPKMLVGICCKDIGFAWKSVV